jgi:hypothetical protein
VFSDKTIVNDKFEKWRYGIVAYFNLEGMNKTTNDHSRASWSSGRDLNSEPPIHESGIVTL